MKKVLVLLITTAIGGAVNAQTFYAQGGVNLANITKNDAGETSDKNVLTTFNVGLMTGFGISKVFDIETGLLFTGKGAKSDTYFTSSKDDNYVKAKFNPYYLEIPVNAVIKFPMNNAGNSNVFISAGPYGAIGVAGKSKIDTKIFGATSSSSENIKFNNDDITTTAQEDAGYGKIKRFDYGINFGAGVSLTSFMIKAGFGLGLAKINSTQNNNGDNDKDKYRTFNVSIGIPLGGK